MSFQLELGEFDPPKACIRAGGQIEELTLELYDYIIPSIVNLEIEKTQDYSSCLPADSFGHRKSLYKITESVYFVPGAKRGAICDTRSGNVYSVNSSGNDVILGKNEDQEFNDKLKSELSLQELPQRPVKVEKEKSEINLEFVWFEIISGDCNERCIHCYGDSMPLTYRRDIDGKSILVFENKPKLTVDQWKKLIKESHMLGCRQCQFTGGESFLWRGENGETVLDLAEYANNVGYETVEIFTNATFINKNNVDRIKNLGINIAVSLYSDKEEVHERITRMPGSFKKTIEALKLLREAGIPTRVETVLMRQNEDTVTSVGDFIQDMGFSNRQPDVLRPKGRGDNPDLIPSPENIVRYSLILGPNFSATKDLFQRSVERHNCLSGKITITDNGDVLPCIFSRGKVVGNVIEEGLIEKILKGNIKDIWEITKDDVLVCQDCEYRYACFDCRPLSEGASGGKGEYKSAPYPRCTYNPYEGEWGNGTWKLNDQSEPFYDENLSEYILKVKKLGLPVVMPR